MGERGGMPRIFLPRRVSVKTDRRGCGKRWQERWIGTGRSGGIHRERWQVGEAIDRVASGSHENHCVFPFLLSAVGRSIRGCITAMKVLRQATGNVTSLSTLTTLIVVVLAASMLGRDLSVLLSKRPHNVPVLHGAPDTAGPMDPAWSSLFLLPFRLLAAPDPDPDPLSSWNFFVDNRE